MSNVYYVYLHRRATDNRHWTNVFKKHGMTVEIVEKDIQEDRAFELEIALIAFFGREKLCPIRNDEIFVVRSGQ